MFVDGRLWKGSAHDQLEVCDPATGQVVETVPAGTAEDVHAAVRAAARGGWMIDGVPLIDAHLGRQRTQGLPRPGP
jgi:acyl-CoA reductase-like NAD-dependent aldehyde dehydrogenase